MVAMIIDSHVHLWRRNTTPQPWIDPESMATIDRDFWIDDLAVALDGSGIDAAVIVQTSNSLTETADLLAASTSDRIVGIVGWVDLAADVPDQIGSLARLPGGENLVGIRHLAHQDPDPRWLLRSDVGQGLNALAAVGLPFDLVISPGQLPFATRAALEHPATSFILDHLAKPSLRSGDVVKWRRDLAAIAELPNVSAKLSGLTIEADWSTWVRADLAPAIEHALDTFGSSRLMFGSDWPLVDLAGGLPRWLECLGSFVTGDDFDAVFGTNALTAYGKARR
jgi:L-fuconolactonase